MWSFWLIVPRNVSIKTPPFCRHISPLYVKNEWMTFHGEPCILNVHDVLKWHFEFQEIDFFFNEEQLSVYSKGQFEHFEHPLKASEIGIFLCFNFQGSEYWSREITILLLFSVTGCVCMEVKCFHTASFFISLKMAMILFDNILFIKEADWWLWENFTLGHFEWSV